MSNTNKANELKAAVESIEVAPVVGSSDSKKPFDIGNEPVINAGTTTAEEKAAAELAKAEMKAVSSFNWINVVAAGSISAAGTLASMIASNKLIDHLELEESKYSVLEIIGVTAGTAVAAAGTQAALNTIGRVNNDEATGLLSVSLVANAAIVTSAYTRDSALAGIRNLLAKKEEVVAE